MKILRLVVIVLVLVALGVFVAQWLARDEVRDWGEVFVRVGGYDVTATVPGAILALILAAVLLWIVWTLLALPFRAWGRHRRKRARAQLIEGLEAVQHGHWLRAEKLLDRAAQDPEVGSAARIAAVRAAQARADAPALERHLQALAQRDPTAHALLLADDALAAGLPTQALVALDAPGAQPLPPRGLALRAQALAEVGRAGDAWACSARCASTRRCRPRTTPNWKRAWPRSRWSRPATPMRWPSAGNWCPRPCAPNAPWWPPTPPGPPRCAGTMRPPMPWNMRWTAAGTKT